MLTNKVLYNKSSKYNSNDINIMFENKYNFVSVSNKYSLLFEITANRKPAYIDTEELITNAYRYYKNIYDIENNIEVLLTNQEFKKDTQILHIAIHHNTGYKLKDIEDFIQTNPLYKEILELRIYDLHKLSDLSDKLVEEINNFSLNTNNKYIIYLLKEIEELQNKYN